MKVRQITNKSVDSYGGLHFFHKFIEKSDLSQVFDLVLGKRPPQAEYSYADVFTSFAATCLAGGTYTEDMNILRKKNDSGTKYQYCSSDTFTRVSKQLIDMENMDLQYTGTDKEVELFYNEPLNRLLLQTYKLFFAEKRKYIVDHDHSKIFTTKPDAKACYKGLGYYASCFSTDQIPLYLSMQSGNATPKTNLVEVLKVGFQAMKKEGLTYEIFRADGACYSEEVLKLVLLYCEDYIVRSRRSQVRQDLINPAECSLVDIRGELYRIYEHTDTFAGKPCRRIYYQKINSEKDLFSEITFDEIITSLSQDHYSTVELIEMYFDRGGSERMFDEVKNDYNGRHLPFKEAPYNLCYIIVCAFSLTVVRAFKVLVHEKVGPYIKPKMRIKRILFRLIAFPAKFMDRSRQEFYDIYCRQKELVPLFEWADSYRVPRHAVNIHQN